MINYDHLRDNDDFMRVLSAIRENCIATEYEIAEIADMDFDVVGEHYRLAQAIVAEEIDHGIVHDPYGASAAQDSWPGCALNTRMGRRHVRSDSPARPSPCTAGPVYLCHCSQRQCRLQRPLLSIAADVTPSLRNMMSVSGAGCWMGAVSSGECASFRGRKQSAWL